MESNEYLEQGKKLALAGKYLEAAESFAEAARLEPENAQAVWFLGIALGEAGKLEDAVGALFQATCLQPDFW